MPVKRRLQVEDQESVSLETPLKRLTKDRNYSPLTGTMPMNSSAKTKAGNCKTSGTAVNAPEAPEPQTETERMDFLRSKVERNLEALMKTRQELVTLLPVEGNIELRNFLLMGPADLSTELKRHKELSSKVNCRVNSTHEKQPQDITQTGTSYEFLKNILSG